MIPSQDWRSGKSRKAYEKDIRDIERILDRNRQCSKIDCKGCFCEFKEIPNWKLCGIAHLRIVLDKIKEHQKVK